MGYPKGIMLYSDHVKSDKSCLDIPEGIDFVVAVALDQLTAEPGFKIHVQEAYNANIPLIAKVDVDIDVYTSMFSEANPAWPTVENDPHMKILKPLFTNSLIHAVLLDIRYDSAAGNWIPLVAKHMREMIKNTWGVESYLLTEDSVLSKYPNGDTNPQVFFSTEKMLSTYTKANSLIGDDTILDPSTDSKPHPNWNGIKFWWYGSQDFDFLSGTKSKLAPIIQYRSGTKSFMWNELGFVPRETTGENNGGDETGTGETGSSEANYSSEDLARIEQKIDDLTDYIKSHIM